MSKNSIFKQRTKSVTLFSHAKPKYAFVKFTKAYSYVQGNKLMFYQGHTGNQEFWLQ